jgi:hypothetical protein
MHGRARIEPGQPCVGGAIIENTGKGPHMVALRKSR